jgi:hypothetical protein
MLKLKFS